MGSPPITNRPNVPGIRLNLKERLKKMRRFLKEIQSYMNVEVDVAAADVEYLQMKVRLTQTKGLAQPRKVWVKAMRLVKYGNTQPSPLDPPLVKQVLLHPNGPEEVVRFLEFGTLKEGFTEVWYTFKADSRDDVKETDESWDDNCSAVQVYPQTA